MGKVSDTLVEGMMFHSENADLMRLMGFMGFARLHEDGYESDAMSYRKVRRLCVDHLDTMCPTGDQSRPKGLEGVSGKRGLDMSSQDRRQMLKTSFEGWHAWESTASERYAVAAEALLSDRHVDLWRHVLKMKRSTEREMVEARRIIAELSSCGWDLAHAYDAQCGLEE